MRYWFERAMDMVEQAAEAALFILALAIFIGVPVSVAVWASYAPPPAAPIVQADVAPPLAGVPLPQPRPAPALPGAMVLVEAGDASGSGFYVGHDTIITAAHVVEGQRYITVETDGDATWSGEVAWVAPAYDVAMLKVPGIRATAVNIDCRKPVMGEPVSIAGNPIMLRFMRTWGHVSSAKIEDLGEWPEAFVVDATSAPGSSGGPIYDVHGGVIGILVGEPYINGKGTFPYSIAVPSITVCGLLART